MYGLREGLATKLRIVTSIDRPIDKISVNEICHLAGISRQTFYNHFESKYDLIPWWGIWCDSFYLDRIGRSLTWEEGYLRSSYLMMWGDKFLSSGMGEISESFKLGAHPVARQRIETLTSTVQYVTGKPPSDELAFCIRAFSHLECEVVIDRCRNREAPRIPLINAKRMVSLIPPLLYGTIQLPDARDKTQLENYRTMDDLDRQVRATLDVDRLISDCLMSS